MQGRLFGANFPALSGSHIEEVRGIRHVPPPDTGASPTDLESEKKKASPRGDKCGIYCWAPHLIITGRDSHIKRPCWRTGAALTLDRDFLRQGLLYRDVCINDGRWRVLGIFQWVIRSQFVINLYPNQKLKRVEIIECY